MCADQHSSPLRVEAAHSGAPLHEPHGSRHPPAAARRRPRGVGARYRCARAHCAPSNPASPRLQRGRRSEQAPKQRAQTRAPRRARGDAAPQADPVSPQARSQP
eukprot:4000870-Prymnesium_polylepis.1